MEWRRNRIFNRGPSECLLSAGRCATSPVDSHSVRITPALAESCHSLFQSVSVTRTRCSFFPVIAKPCLPLSDSCSSSASSSELRRRLSEIRLGDLFCPPRCSSNALADVWNAPIEHSSRDSRSVSFLFFFFPFPSRPGG